MPSERIEIGHAAIYPTAPSEKLLQTIGSKDSKFGHYNSADYQRIQNEFKTEAAKEADTRVQRANQSLLETIDAVHAFAVAAKYERNNTTGRWQKPNKLKAVRAAELTMFTADALSRQPALLELFWGKIYQPLAKSSGLIDSELEPITNGMMAELATGKALDMIFKKQGKRWVEVFKTTPEEDVNYGKDLVVKQHKMERPIQVKLLRGGEKPHIRWVNGEISEAQLYYGKNVEELFNPKTGQPTDELINQLSLSLPKSFISQH